MASTGVSRVVGCEARRATTIRAHPPCQSRGFPVLL